MNIKGLSIWLGLIVSGVCFLGLHAETIGIRIVTERPTSEKIIVGYTEKMTLIGDLKPEITVLARLTTGVHQLDLSKVPPKTDLLYFVLDGYAPIYLRLKNGDRRVSEIEARLFLKRYVTMRYAEDSGGPDFSLTKGDNLVLTQFAYPGEGAWHLLQGNGTSPYTSGTEPWISYWQAGSPQWGALQTDKTFDSMSLAPTKNTDIYVGKNYLLKKDSRFFMKDTQGYAKLGVTNIGTEKPEGAKIIEFSPTFKEN